MSRRDGLQLGAAPSIDLTPPEVKARRQGSGLRRALVMAFVGSLAIVALGFGAASLLASNAAAQLQASRDQSVQLLAQQQQYSEVMSIASRTREITQARQDATAPEVLWKPFLDQVQSVLPADAVLTSVTATGRLSTDPELVPAGVLRKPLVASLELIVNTRTVPDAAEWMRRLSPLTGYADHSLSTLLGDGSVYTSTITLNLSADALANRFAPPVASTTDSTGTDQTSTDQAPTRQEADQ